MDESSVEISEPKEYLDILIALRLRPFLNGLDTYWVHYDALGCYDKAEELHELSREGAF
jgi:hypothetical protein